MAKAPKSKIVKAVGVAVGRHGDDKTTLGQKIEAAMHNAIMQGRDKGETDDQIRDRIHAARDEVLNAE
jgi:lactam utilization protein B